ncbi:hypothetical protein KVR01_010622 [Diaporthe batatas]|uniref:uncharacterized protein n=1 Tax=Diaporthe batatas TaxID=748121 RepID=UPI001D047561|nr:uncharacterized protein KVR01_010622 [Diaporthe batatas]KAG8159985.1 hypothetical protein KVR01_010622 [Diaporthe batatas]
MVGSTDVETLLSTGAWTTQRAKTPGFANPVRANQSSKLEPLGPKGSKASRPSAFLSGCHRFPPPPSVEDEAVSIAKEQGTLVAGVSDEEPKCRGDVEQNPIILPVPEFNPERRYVLVTPSETDDACLSDTPAQERPVSTPRTEYPANTKIPLDRKADDAVRPDIQRRRSRVDLPRIETDVPPPRSKTPSRVQRARSATCVDQKPRETQDYFSPHPESARPVADAFLSPVIKHSTKGRDRAYWNFNSGSEGTSPRGSASSLKPSSADRKGLDGYARSPLSSSPAAQRRTHSAMDVPREPRRAAERESSYKTELPVRARRNGPPSPTLDQCQLPPRSTRRDLSPPTSRAPQPKLSRRKSSYSNRPSVSRAGDYGFSSDEDRDHRRSRTHHDRRKSTFGHGDRPNLLSPGLSSVSKTKSRPPSPLPSPKSSHAHLPHYEYQEDPRSSTATLNTARYRHRNENERPVSPMSSGDSSPRDHSRLTVGGSGNRPRAASRTPSIRSNASTGKPGTNPASVSASISNPAATATEERKRQTMPPSPAYSRQGSLEAIHDAKDHWQPEPFAPDQSHISPRQSANGVEQPPPVVSYRRFSEDVNAGAKPGLPDCPMKRPTIGYTNWLTLPRCDNFTICLSCYEQVFYPTEFRDMFYQAPYRFKERELSCDLGTSPWYQIAWLMTRKYRRTDIRLIQGVSGVLSKERIPCYGSARVTRMWYSITDPDTRHCLPGFRVCSPCAKSVEILFPSLMGVFVPRDRYAEPKSGECSLHFTENRNRFLIYFDVFEKCHDVAMDTKSAPDVQRLADNINFWAKVDECPRDEPLRNAKWNTMSSIPEMTVCHECFLEVVFPELVADVNSHTVTGSERRSVARDFYQNPSLINEATVCQMASPKMREVFRRACKLEDGIDFLDDQIRRRMGY